MGEAKRKAALLAAQPKEHDGHDILRFALGKYTVEMFPAGYIALNKELATGYHPALEKNLNNYPVDEVDIRLATIATYCGIVMDGAYPLDSRSELCSILAGRLEMLRDLTKGHGVQVIRPVQEERDWSTYLTKPEAKDGTDSNSENN